MTLHINFKIGFPTVYENIRLLTTYLHPDFPAEPEIVIHHEEPRWGQKNIPLRDVASYWIAP
jgi:hypothetical protein